MRFALARAALLPVFFGGFAGAACGAALVPLSRHVPPASGQAAVGPGPGGRRIAAGTCAVSPQPCPQPAPLLRGCHILLPVYQAFDLLPEVLDRITRHTDLPWQLTVIEDASPDPAIRPFLRHWAQDKPQVQLIENDENLGFIGAMNRGLAAALAYSDQPAPIKRARSNRMIVLLNSDALVPQDGLPAGGALICRSARGQRDADVE